MYQEHPLLCEFRTERQTRRRETCDVTTAAASSVSVRRAPTTAPRGATQSTRRPAPITRGRPAVRWGEPPPAGGIPSMSAPSTHRRRSRRRRWPIGGGRPALADGIFRSIRSPIVLPEIHLAIKSTLVRLTADRASRFAGVTFGPFVAYEGYEQVPAYTETCPRRLAVEVAASQPAPARPEARMPHSR